MVRHFLFIILILSLVTPPVFADGGIDPKPIDFSSGGSVTFEFSCPLRDNREVRVTLTPVTAESVHFDPDNLQGYEEVIPFANPSIRVDIWMTHSGWWDNQENPADILRECVQGGGNNTTWTLSPESDMWANIDTLSTHPFQVTQGDQVTTMEIIAATVIDHEYLDEYSQDVRGIIGLIAEIDPRFEDLLEFHFTPDPQAQDFFLITCLWGPYGQPWRSYSQTHGYYEYARLVLWLRVNTDPQEGSLP